ncbi:MAG TPA: hypothetical protein VJ672_13860 [Gemmatimonadaceae bacterium]|nr:hypothetical protein [Gemmatimonadaceae bacterium]
MVARLASGTLGDTPLPAPVRSERATAARGWLASLTVPPTIRAAMLRVAEASAGDGAELGEAVRALAAAVAPQLDGASRTELDRLAREIET